MIKDFIVTTAVAVVLSAGTAGAATLNLLGSGQTSTIDDFSSATSKNNIKVGGVSIAPHGTVLDIITGDVKDATNGLELIGGPARITYTYLGSEAGNSNFGAQIGTTNFTNGPGGSSIGDSITVTQALDGLLDFVFGTTAPASAVGEIMNNGGATAAVGNLYDFAIGYIKISDTSFYALFDDIAQGDRDFDDLALRIDVAPIPLPAGGLLLITGLGGMAALRRRKKAA